MFYKQIIFIDVFVYLLRDPSFLCYIPQVWYRFFVEMITHAVMKDCCCSKYYNYSMICNRKIKLNFNLHTLSVFYILQHREINGNPCLTLI